MAKDPELRIDEPIDITITINVRARMQMDGEIDIITEQIIRDLALTPLRDKLLRGKIHALTFSVRNNLVEAQEVIKKNQ